METLCVSLYIYLRARAVGPGYPLGNILCTTLRRPHGPIQPNYGVVYWGRSQLRYVHIIDPIIDPLLEKK